MTRPGAGLWGSECGVARATPPVESHHRAHWPEAGPQGVWNRLRHQDVRASVEGVRCIRRNPRFATFGGMVYLRGSACNGIARTTWMRLAKSVYPGDKEILLSEAPPPGPQWAPGARILVASTDWDDAQTEEVAIETVVGKVVVLNRPLHFAHCGAAPAAAEVATLTRNIIVTSAGNCEAGDRQERQLGGARKPLCGNFIISHTPHGVVCGVEFTRLGSQTTLGKYPLHLHMCGRAHQLVIRANSIHDNFNRALVSHGT